MLCISCPACWYYGANSFNTLTLCVPLTLCPSHCTWHSLCVPLTALDTHCVSLSLHLTLTVCVSLTALDTLCVSLSLHLTLTLCVSLTTLDTLPRKTCPVSQGFDPALPLKKKLYHCCTSEKMQKASLAGLMCHYIFNVFDKQTIDCHFLISKTLVVNSR